MQRAHAATTFTGTEKYVHLTDLASLHVRSVYNISGFPQTITNFIKNPNESFERNKFFRVALIVLQSDFVITFRFS